MKKSSYLQLEPFGLVDYRRGRTPESAVHCRIGYQAEKGNALTVTTPRVDARLHASDLSFELEDCASMFCDHALMKVNLVRVNYEGENASTSLLAGLSRIVHAAFARL